MSPQAASRVPLRVLVIGSDGLIGAALYERLLRRGHAVIGTTRRKEELGSSNKIFLDLTESSSSAASSLPDADVAIICTAMSSFAACRKQPELAKLINATAPADLGQRLIERGMSLIRLSSTAVFQNSTPMAPALQPPNSRALYGRLQAEGERLALALSPSISIVRFTKIATPNFPVVTKWISALLRGETIEAFEDHGLCPVTLATSIDALTDIIESRRNGTYQISASRDLSYVEFAIYLVDRIGLPRQRVVAVRAADKGIPIEEIIPFSSLDSTSLTELTGFQQPDPIAALDEVFGLMIRETRERIG